MKKALAGLVAAAFLVVSSQPIMAASDLHEWLAKPENAELKKKWDALPKDKQAQIEKEYIECKKDVEAGKLPKGSCKPKVQEKLSK